MEKNTNTTLQNFTVLMMLFYLLSVFLTSSYFVFIFSAFICLLCISCFFKMLFESTYTDKSIIIWIFHTVMWIFITLINSLNFIK